VGGDPLHDRQPSRVGQGLGDPGELVVSHRRLDLGSIAIKSTAV
jgi:hypothetical protein